MHYVCEQLVPQANECYDVKSGMKWVVPFNAKLRMNEIIKCYEALGNLQKLRKLRSSFLELKIRLWTKASPVS